MSDKRRKKSRTARSNSSRGRRRPEPRNRMLPQLGGSNLTAYILWALKICAIVVWDYSLTSDPHRKPRSVDDLHSVMRKLHRADRGHDISVVLLNDDKAYQIGLLFLGLTLRRKNKDTLILLNPHLDRA